MAGRVSLQVHRRFLARFVRPGARVLEIGAGPGRFTTELAALGASVVVTDISAVQLNLNREHVCQMFRASQLSELATKASGRLVATSATSWASLGDAEALATLEADPDRWARFLDNEVAACAEPGAADGGTHILFAVEHD